MNPGFHIISFSKINDQLRDSIDWLKTFVPNITPTRFGQYQKDIEYLIKVLNENKLHLLNKPVSSSKIMNSLYEADEIIQIYEGLSNCGQTEYLKNKIPIFVKGPVEVKSEKESASAHMARDISFELFIASLFLRTSFKIDFSTEADLLLNKSDYSLFIECKRPNSINSVHSNIKIASSQLKKRFNLLANKENVYGIIILSVDNIINPTHSLIYTSDEYELTRMLESNMKAFIQNNKQYWNKIDDKKIIGIISFFKSFGIYEDKKLPLYIRYALANNIINRSEKEINILKEIATLINKHISNT